MNRIENGKCSHKNVWDIRERHENWREPSSLSDLTIENRLKTNEKTQKLRVGENRRAGYMKTGKRPTNGKSIENKRRDTKIENR